MSMTSPSLSLSIQIVALCITIDFGQYYKTFEVKMSLESWILLNKLSSPKSPSYWVNGRYNHIKFVITTYTQDGRLYSNLLFVCKLLPSTHLTRLGYCQKGAAPILREQVTVKRAPPRCNYYKSLTPNGSKRYGMTSWVGNFTWN